MYLVYILYQSTDNLYFNQHKRKNCCRNYFITKYSQKNVPDVGIDLGVASILSDGAAVPSQCMFMGHRQTEMRRPSGAILFA